MQPELSCAGCYIRVADVDTLYQAFSAATMHGYGIALRDRLENKPWGLREFAMVDPDGNLLRIGQVLEI